MHLAYQVDQTLFDSKVKALLSANGDVSRIKLRFYDNIWDEIDWSVEPEPSWRDLIEAEAQRIRQNYDHVAVWYSGGYDSHTVVDAFLSQGLVIDELVVYRRGWLDYTKHEFDYALGRAQQIKKDHCPRLKITALVKQAQDIESWYASHKNYWTEHPGAFYWLGKTSRRWEHEHYLELRPPAGKTSIYIEGRDKPRLDLRDGWWYVTCDDRLARWAMDSHPDLDFNFYWNTINPAIHVKQVHMMIRWLETEFDVTHDIVHRVQAQTIGPEVYEAWNLAIGRTPLTWYDARYGEGLKKDYVGGINSKDSQALAAQISGHKESIYQQWQQGIHDLKSNLAQAWDDNANDFQVITAKGWPVRPLRPRTMMSEQDDHCL